MQCNLSSFHSRHPTVLEPTLLFLKTGSCLENRSTHVRVDQYCTFTEAVYPLMDGPVVTYDEHTNTAVDVGMEMVSMIQCRVALLCALPLLCAYASGLTCLVCPDLQTPIQMSKDMTSLQSVPRTDFATKYHSSSSPQDQADALSEGISGMTQATTVLVLSGGVLAKIDTDKFPFFKPIIASVRGQLGKASRASLEVVPHLIKCYLEWHHFRCH